MNLESIKVEFFQLVDTLAKWAVSPKFYAQIIAIALAIFLAWTLAKILKRKVSFLHTPPVDSKSKLAHLLLGSMYTARDLVFTVKL